MDWKTGILPLEGINREIEVELIIINPKTRRVEIKVRPYFLNAEKEENTKIEHKDIMSLIDEEEGYEAWESSGLGAAINNTIISQIIPLRDSEERFNEGFFK